MITGHSRKYKKIINLVKNFMDIQLHGEQIETNTFKFFERHESAIINFPHLFYRIEMLFFI